MNAQPQVLDLLAAQRGHFLLESGITASYGSISNCCAPNLAARLSKYNVDVVCGPLVEGAFVGLMVASELGAQFSCSERFMRPGHEGLFPARYRVPASLRPTVKGKRVAIVNDVINAGSTVKGTYADLTESGESACGANVVAIGALLVLGSAAYEFARAKGLELESVAQHRNRLWEPATCPMCASGMPREDIGGFAIGRG